MKLKRLMTVVALTAALPCFAADPVPVTLSGFAYGWQQTTINNTDPGNLKTVTAAAGAFLGKLDGSSFVTFCTDIYQTLSFGSTTYQYDRLSVADTKGLWGGDPNMGTTYNPNSYDLVSKLFTTAFSQVSTAVSSAAFQFALWEVLYEKSDVYNVTSGNLTLTGNTSGFAAARDLANTWLTAATGPGAVAGHNVQSLYIGPVNPNGGGRQDLVIATPVPEPAAYALALVSLGIVAGYARRKRAKD